MAAPLLKRKRSVSNNSTSSVPLPTLCSPNTPITIPDIESSRDVSIVENMAEVGPVDILTNDGARDEENVQDDSDLEDGDQVMSRGYPRNPDNLVKHGFRPVWTLSRGYLSSDFPADMEEVLNDIDTSKKQAKYVGPLRSLAWLAGLDELIEAIDSPAYIIEDCIEIVPLDPITNCGQTLILWDESPKGVTEMPTLFTLRDITGTSRLQRPSGKILCMKIRSQKGVDSLAAKIKRQVEDLFESGEFWFRGLSVPALKSTLAFFVPETNGSNRDNEFGPGFYTTNSLEHSLLYLRGGVGAIMVFKQPNLFHSTVWQPSLSDWTAWIARWTSRPLAIASDPVPKQYDTADFIRGPISADRGSRAGNAPTQSEGTQLVAVSFKGCQGLSDSLFMIIFVDPK
ncbi:uncharacterized protein N7477_009006 [Penicillium maclennaniae]|uniref:uncharacterized protein n=1 Tax=Penicillium maclennaniae TaxID=1343394 RepID=UPI0025420DF0|nr:uncharacterized protein N7477_009006 [Penicillium maclennaniae]KAJ5661390.1 hypothetical protein N7477_009006 [Penicillium maclennaniae]